MNRILWNRRVSNENVLGCIDELVVHDATVHIEQMSEQIWWIGIDFPDGGYWAGNFSCHDGRLRFSEQENHGVEWDRDESHEEKRP